MQLNFRQGLVAIQTDSGIPKYLKASTTAGYVSLNVNPTPSIFTLAHGSSDYLLKFDTLVDLAWQITGPYTTYLYVDVDQLTAATTFGTTTVMPITALTAPSNPADGQHWFDLTNTVMNVWSAARQKWQVKIRLIVGSVLNGNTNTIQMFGTGSTIGLNTPASAGYIMLDTLLNPLRKSSMNGEFLTNGDDVRILTTVGTSGVLVQPAARVIPVRAIESIPKMSLVYFYDDDVVKLADSDPALSPAHPPVGMVIDALANGDVGTFVQAGEISYDQWNWEGYAGSPVYCDSFGQVTLTRPAGLMAYRVGFIKNAQTILLNIDAETLPSVYTSDVNSLIISGQTPVVANDVVNGLGERVVTISVPNSSESSSGLITGAQVTTYDGYGTQITANTGAIATLQTSKANTVHTHVIADVTGLQADLDTLTSAITTKANLVSPATIGNFVSLVAGGQMADSGYSSASFAPLVHQHVIGDVSGLQTALDAKAYRSHLNMVSEIYTVVDRTGPFDIGSGSTLQSLLDGKITVGTTFPISQIINLQPSLDNKMNVGDPIPVSQVTNLQADLDNKAYVSHTQAISTITGLQTALNALEPTINPGTTAQYWRGDKTWQNFPALGSTTLAGLTDVALTYPIPNQVLTFNGGDWVNANVSISTLHDTSISSPVAGQVLEWNGTRWENATLTASPTALAGLSDVTLTSPVSANYLSYNGTKWVNTAFPTLVQNLTDLQDVAISYASSGQVLTFDGGTWQAEYINLALEGLHDVSINSATSGQFLSWNGTSWVNVNAPAAGATALSALTDVAVTYIQNGQVLMFNGSEWVNQYPTTISQLQELSDVQISSPLNTQVLTYNSSIARWTNQEITLAGNLSDVLLSSPAAGQFLSFNGTQWVNVAAPSSGGASALSGLSDVAIGYLNYQDVLMYDGSVWRNTPSNQIPAAPQALHTLTDVYITALADGQVLTYSAADSTWENKTPVGTPVLGQTLYVDPTGNDTTGTGSITKPFATLTAAQNYATTSLNPNLYVNIVMAAGVYATAATLTRPRTIVTGAGREYGTIFTGALTISPTAVVGNTYTSLFTLADVYLQPTTGDALTITGSSDCSVNLDRVKAFGGAAGQRLINVTTTSTDKTVIRMTKFDGKNTAANIDAVTFTNATVSLDDASIEAGDAHALVVGAGTSLNSLTATLINTSTTHDTLHVAAGATYNNSGGTITANLASTGVFVEAGGVAGLVQTAILVPAGGVAIGGQAGGIVEYAQLAFGASSTVQNVTYIRVPTSDATVIKPAPLTVLTSSAATTYDFGSAAQHNMLFRSTSATDVQVLVHADGTFTGTDTYDTNNYSPMNPGPMPAGGLTVFRKQGTGNVVFVPDGGVTINSTGTLTISTIGKATLTKVGPNEWDLDGAV